MLNELAKEIHENAIEHGWWDGDRNKGELIALMHSELSEALEELRAGRPGCYFYTEIGNEHTRVTGLPTSGCEKLEGEYVEIVDCIIRALDYLCHECCDIDSILHAKMEYNKNRPYKHGKIF